MEGRAAMLTKPYLVIYWDCVKNDEDILVCHSKTTQDAVNMFQLGKKKGTYKIISVWSAADDWTADRSVIYDKTRNS